MLMQFLNSIEKQSKYTSKSKHALVEVQSRWVGRNVCRTQTLTSLWSLIYSALQLLLTNFAPCLETLSPVLVLLIKKNIRNSFFH